MTTGKHGEELATFLLYKEANSKSRFNTIQDELRDDPSYCTVLYVKTGPHDRENHLILAALVPALASGLITNYCIPIWPVLFFFYPHRIFTLSTGVRVFANRSCLRPIKELWELRRRTGLWVCALRSGARARQQNARGHRLETSVAFHQLPCPCSYGRPPRARRQYKVLPKAMIDTRVSQLDHITICPTPPFNVYSPCVPTRSPNRT